MHVSLVEQTHNWSISFMMCLISEAVKAIVLDAPEVEVEVWRW